MRLYARITNGSGTRELPSVAESAFAIRNLTPVAT